MSLAPRFDMYRWLSASCVMALAIMSSHCTNDSSGNYDASLADLRNDVKLTLDVALDRSGELSLLRWFGDEAYGWKHCPVIHAAGSVNGRALSLADAGGWVPVSPGKNFLEGTGGYCRDVRYRFNEGALEGLTGADIVFHLEDESGVMELQVPYLADGLALSLRAPTPDTLIPGQRAGIALLPSVAAIDVEGCSMSYRGELAHKTLVRQYAAFDVAASSLQVTDQELSFVTPSVDDSRGKLVLDCKRGTGPWSAGIARCEGAAGCAATRHDPAALAVEVSVSPTGQPVTVDPTQDPAGWSSCWFSARASGGAEKVFALTGEAGCSGGLDKSTATLSMSWGRAGPSTHAALRVTGVNSLELDKELAGELELTLVSNTWRTLPGACRLTLTRVELDTRFKTADTYVVQGTGTCPDPISPSPSTYLDPLNVGPFEFRAGVLVPM